MSMTFFKDVFGNYDKLEGDTQTEKNTTFQERSPKERLIETFTPNEFGEFTNEVNTILEVSCMSMFIGALYGGVMSSKTAYLDFFRNNQATVFKDHLEAKKRLQDKVTLAFGKGAFRWGWRLTLFSTSYVGFTTAVSVYRGKNGILEHVIAGGLAGSLYKFNAGPRGMLVGGILGNVLGLFAGCTTLALLKMSGLELSDVRNNSKRWHNARSGKLQEGLRQHYGQQEGQEIVQYSKKDLIDNLDSVNTTADSSK